MRAIAVFCALICAGALSASCGGDDASAGVKVSMREMHFTPSSLSVVEGRTTIVAHNNGTLTHTFSINKIGQEVTVPPGKTRRLTVDLAPGTYRYVCRILDHEGLGMHGVLKVRSK